MTQVATIGQRLADRYLVESILGAGAHGRVFAAYDTRTGTRVALKECVRGGDGFLREISALFELDHPHVLRCHTVLISGPYRYIVTELMDGGSLRGILNDLGGNVHGTLGLFRQAVMGVIYAHSRRLVHRDLKPENILLGRVGDRLVAKVSDFGISTMHTGLQTRSCIGSPAYMAPEQFYDAYDGRVDVYALGVMLFEILCGCRPFYGSPAQILLSHLQRDVAIPEWMPPRFAALIRGSLEKDPDQRIPSVAQFLEKLDEALATERDRLDGGGWPVAMERADQIALTRHAVHVRHGSDVAVLDRRGRCLERLNGVDGLWATDEHILLRRGGVLELRTPRGNRQLGVSVGDEARVALSPDGTVAVVQDGGARVVDTSGVFELHAAGTGVRDACFAGEEHDLFCLREEQGRRVLEGGDSVRNVEADRESVVGHTERFELLLLGSEDTRATLFDFAGPRPVALGCRQLVCDGENFLGVDDVGRLVTLNGRTGRVARTFVDEPLAAVGACSDGVVWATRDGRLVSVRAEMGG